MIEIKQGSKSDYTFNILSDNGQVLLKSIPFSGNPAMETIILELKMLMAQPAVFERRTNYNGQFLFLLKDGKGKTIGNSMFYSSEAGMENGIENLKSSISQLPNALHQ